MQLQVDSLESKGCLNVKNTRHSLLSLDSNPSDQFLSKLLLESRLLSGVHVEFGEPFPAKWENQIMEHLRALPWKLFLKKDSPIPEVHVKSVRSRLMIPKHIAGLVKRGFAEFAGISRDMQLESIPINEEKSKEALRLFVRIEDDQMRLSVDAGGPNLNNLNLQKYSRESRLDISEPIASAMIQTSLLPAINSLANSTTIWDPLCGGGIIPLVTAHVLAGIPSGSPMVEYPFRKYSIHNPIIFAEQCDSLRLSPHPRHSLISVLGSDSSIEAVDVARKNLEVFRSLLPHVENGETMPFPLTIQRHADAYSPPPCDDLAIICSLPGKGDTERKYKRFHELVESVGDRLVGCVVATSRSNQFRKLSSKKWITDLRVYDGRREIEILRLFR
jgi:23S rRNA G2445 N2-methylase RlmL